MNPSVWFVFQNKYRSVYQYIDHLQHKVVLGLQLEIQHGLLDVFLEVHVPFARNVKRWEQVQDQAHEHRHVISHNLRDVKVSQRSHQHLILRSARITSLQRTSHNQHRLNGPQAPVIVILKQDDTVNTVREPQQERENQSQNHWVESVQLQQLKRCYTLTNN